MLPSLSLAGEKLEDLVEMLLPHSERLRAFEIFRNSFLLGGMMLHFKTTT